MHVIFSSETQIDSSDTESELQFYAVRQQLGRNIFNIRRHHFELFDDLGSGQFGAVKKARYCDGTTNIYVAVKMLKTDVNIEGSSQVSNRHYYDCVLS
jgi:hypothetical protein